MENTPRLLKFLVAVGMFLMTSLMASLALALLVADTKPADDRTAWICSPASLLSSPKTAL